MTRKNLNKALDFNRLSQSLVDLNNTREVTSNDVFLVLDLEEVQALAQPKQISLSGIQNSLEKLPGFIAAVSGIATTTHQTYFLNAFDTTTQLNQTASGSAMRFNTSVDSRGITVTSGTMLQVAHSGVYNIQFSAQLEKTSANKEDVDIWLRKNDVDVPWSSTTISVNGSSEKQVAAWNFFLSMDTKEYAQIYWHTVDTNLKLVALSGSVNPVHSDTPSVIVTVNNVS